MKLSLTSRIILSFLLLSAALLATVGVLSYRSGSKSLQADAMAEMLAKAIEKEAALDAWIAERLSDIREISGEADVVEKAARLIAAVPASQEARAAHAILLEELEPPVSHVPSRFTELFVIEAESGKVVASTSPSQEGKVKLGHPYFDQGRTNLYLQPAYYSADTAGPAMTAVGAVARERRPGEGGVGRALGSGRHQHHYPAPHRTAPDGGFISPQCRAIAAHSATLHHRACRAAPHVGHRGRRPLCRG